MIDKYPTRLANKEAILPRGEFPVASYSPTIGVYQSRRYEIDGSVVVKGFFDRDHTRNLYKAAHDTRWGVEGVMLEPANSSVRTVLGIHERSIFREVSKDQMLLKIAESLLGGSIYIHQSRINYKHPMTGSGWSWHSDFETWHAQDGMPEMHCLTAMIPLCENTTSNGPLLTIPGSHMDFISCKKTEQADYASNWGDQKDGLPSNVAIAKCLENNGGRVEPVICSPGDLVLFDCNVLHGSTNNMSSEGRANLFFVFNRRSNALVAPFAGTLPRPEYAATRIKMEEAFR